MQRQRILVTGSTGQVGSAIARLLAAEAEILQPTRAELDLSDADALRAYVRNARPDWIVNPAAYTAVDKAESEPALAHALNVEAPRILGKEAHALDVPVLHFSTDYIFSGESTKPYTEQDLPGPTSVYGRSKLAGEQALAATGAAHVILRTSWVYGATGKNFLLTILRAAAQRAELRIVADQHGAPTWAEDLARLTAHIMAFARARDTHAAEALRPLSGVYHATAAGETTWFGFAQTALDARRARRPEEKLATLTPILTAEYPTPARRPVNSRLDCTRLANTFEFRLPDWRESLAHVLDELDPQDANPHGAR